MVPEVMRASPYMDHRMTLEVGLKIQLPNPREAWGQTLQLRQRTQADDPQLRGYTGHRATLDTLCGVVAGAGGSHGTPRTLDTLCGEVAGAGGSQVTMGSNTAAPATDSRR
jgi:hypothetical protein